MICDFPDLIHPSYSLLHNATIKCYAGMHTSISLSKLMGWILTAGHTAERELVAIKQDKYLSYEYTYLSHLYSNIITRRA